MLTKRIIPCLDVKDGRVVKGVQFLELRDAGDPVEAAEAYDAQGADELTFLDITASRDKRGIILDVVRRTAERVFMPLTVGGGVREMRRHPQAAQRRRRQGLDQYRRRPPPRVRQARRPSASAPSARGGDRRPPRPVATRSAGRSTPMADAIPPASMRSRGRERMAAYGAARSCSPRWTSDGTKDGYDIGLTRAVSRRGFRFR